MLRVGGPVNQALFVEPSRQSSPPSGRPLKFDDDGGNLLPPDPPLRVGDLDRPHPDHIVGYFRYCSLFPPDSSASISVRGR